MTALADVSPTPSGARRVPCLGDLVAAPDLNLVLAVGDDTSLERPVRGVHAIDLLHPAKWIDRGWVLLTTGSSLADVGVAEQRGYVAELMAAGVSALGFGVGIVVDEIPPAITAAAEDLGLPVLTVAPETPFRSVVSYAHELEYGAVTRRLELHSRLVATIGSSTPEQALAMRVSSILSRPARLVDGGGHVVAAAGDQSSDEHGSEHVVTPTQGALRLLVPTRSSDGAEELAVLDVAREVLRLLSAREEFHTGERRLARAELVDDVLKASTAANAHAVQRRLLSYGVDATAEMAMVAIEATGPTPDAIGVIEAMAYSCGLAGIFAQEGETIVGLVQIGDDAAVSEFLGRVGRDWHVGVGEGFSGVAKASGSARIAEAALRIAHRRGGRRGAVVTHTDLGFGSWLLASMDPSLATRRAARRLAVLQEQPLVFEAVKTYLECDLSVAKAAEALFIHANSLRYRLSRAELALGAPLRKPEIITDLFLALQAADHPTYS